MSLTHCNRKALIISILFIYENGHISFSYIFLFFFMVKITGIKQIMTCKYLNYRYGTIGSVIILKAKVEKCIIIR